MGDKTSLKGLHSTRIRENFYNVQQDGITDLRTKTPFLGIFSFKSSNFLRLEVQIPHTSAVQFHIVRLVASIIQGHMPSNYGSKLSKYIHTMSNFKFICDQETIVHGIDISHISCSVSFSTTTSRKPIRVQNTIELDHQYNIHQLVITLKT